MKISERLLLQRHTKSDVKKGIKTCIVVWILINEFSSFDVKIFMVC